jgi:hypothetical protein
VLAVKGSGLVMEKGKGTAMAMETGMEMVKGSEKVMGWVKAMEKERALAPVQRRQSLSNPLPAANLAHPIRFSFSSLPP